MGSHEPKPRLRLLAGTFAVYRLPADATVPRDIAEAVPIWTARTDAELSIVCRADPALAAAAGETSADWAAIEVAGPIEHTVVGLLAEISAVLAAERISIFALSTYDTDYVLVPSSALDRAFAALAAAGFARSNAQ